MRSIVVTICLALLLVACEEEDNALLGTWKGEITPEQARELDVPLDPGSTEFIVDFIEGMAVLNGRPLEVHYDKNIKSHFVNEAGTNRAMNAQFIDEDPNRIVLRIPGRRRQGLIKFEMQRVAEPPGAN